jgi:hypothetical protein
MARGDEALADGVDDDLGMFLGEVRNPRDFLDELRFRHAAGVHEITLRSQLSAVSRQPDADADN